MKRTSKYVAGRLRPYGRLNNITIVTLLVLYDMVRFVNNIMVIMLYCFRLFYVVSMMCRVLAGLASDVWQDLDGRVFRRS